MRHALGIRTMTTTTTPRDRRHAQTNLVTRRIGIWIARPARKFPFLDYELIKTQQKTHVVWFVFVPARSFTGRRGTGKDLAGGPLVTLRPMRMPETADTAKSRLIII